MSEMSDDEYTWEDAEEGVTLDMEALLDEIDGEYRPPEEYEDDDDDYVDFDDEDDDYEPGLHIDDGEYEVREMDESEDEDDGGPFAHEHSDVAGAHISLVQLAALMNATTGEGAASLVERLLGPGRGFGVPRQRSLGQQAAQKISERWWKPQVEPHPAGMALLQSGEFGPVGPWSAGTTRRRPSEIYTARRYAAGPYARADGARRYTSTRYFTSAHVREPPIPNTMGTVVAAYPDVPYVGQFCGNDDSMFYSATRGFMLHLYNMNASIGSRPKRRPAPPAAQATPATPPLDADYLDGHDSDGDNLFGGGYRTRRAIRNQDTSLHPIKTVQGVVGQWTVTDADADRSGSRMIYSSITPHVNMLYTAEDDSEHYELDFSNSGGGRDRYGEGFGIWSIRFSADGKEVVAGGSEGRIMVYDIAAERRSLRVIGHVDDVNAVCFADESSTNVLVSGSDDGFVKVWDRRSLASSTPAGVLPGATEGITYTAPKGDGRYIVVNSKDQAARLYDLRKMRSWSEFETEREQNPAYRYGHERWDYRRSKYPAPRRHAHPRDCSVMTYRGHCVLRTLIRCHFSPVESTGQSYIYSGSADGLIHIWSLDGRVVHVLNRADSTPLKRRGEYTDPSATETGGVTRLGVRLGEYGTNYTVRDVAWHSRVPMLMSTCWELSGGSGFGGQGSIAMHEWKGLGKGGLRSLEDWVEKTAAEENQRPSQW